VCTISIRLLFEDYLHTTIMANTETVTTLERLANLLRIHSIESTQAANSGLDKLIIYLFLFIYLYYRHPTSCASMAEITSVLFYNVMRYDPQNPRNPAADRFVLSKVNIKLVCKIFYFQGFIF
jgi:transketolase